MNKAVSLRQGDLGVFVVGGGAGGQERVPHPTPISKKRNLNQQIMDKKYNHHLIPPSIKSQLNGLHYSKE